MKKLVGVLVVLVIVLGGVLIFEYVKEFKEETKAKGEAVAVTAITTKKAEKPTGTNKTYHFKDIESKKKATSIQEAFEVVFGKGRLFDDFKDSDSYSDYEKSNFKDPYDGQIKYYLKGVYKTENIPVKDWFKYNPEKQYIFDSVIINITMKPGVDTRMEMIDFLHYLKFSGLTKPHYIKESLPEDSVKVNGILNSVNATPEKIPPFTIYMSVFQPIKSGMNTPEPHQEWSISSDIIEKMDFSDEEDVLNNINMYGKFKGVNPSGMK